jgi:ABC-type branched-subunit amino acid transport system substrate-binding protein
MLSVLSRARKALAGFSAVAGVVVLAACTPTTDTAVGPITTKVQVALLVPGGSGQASDELLARSLENAARLAITDLGGAQIDLRVYATAGQPAQAAQMATLAVQDGAQIILGPVFAQEANAAGLAVNAAAVNVLSFSNNTEVAGGNVFVMGPTFDNSAARLARYAVQSGKSKVMIVYDQNSSGEQGRAAIERGVLAAGGQVVAKNSYEFSQNGIVQAGPAIAAAAQTNGAQSIFFTADTAGALPLITQMLADQNLRSDTVQFIGLTRWDIPAATLSLPGVQGGLFAMPDPALFAQYQARYLAAYGEPPHPISGLAYDGIAAIGALLKQGTTGVVTREALTQGSGFVGVNGIFRLRGDGTNERGLAIARVTSGQAIIVDPAPRGFGGAGF